MYNKILFILSLVFLIASCNSVDSIKRGLTGEKRQGADEFLIKKKDPLILPPDFQDLPLPDERIIVKEETSNFEKAIEEAVIEETSATSSIEQSILKKIQKR